jgi:hypothetical protein
MADESWRRIEKYAPWRKVRPDTDELVWQALQLTLAHGPLEPWEIPLVVYGENLTILSIKAYIQIYKKEDV